MNAVEVRNPGFPADLASSGRGGDMDYVSCVDVIDVVPPSNGRRAVMATVVVVPAKGVNAENRDGSACRDGDCT
jgi:hypothetical protein